MGRRQHRWLVADLEAVERNRRASLHGGRSKTTAYSSKTTAYTPWVVVTLHRMLYTTQLCEDADYANSLLLRKQLEPILRKYKVNLVLVGHQHSYVGVFLVSFVFSFALSCGVVDDWCTHVPQVLE